MSKIKRYLVLPFVAPLVIILALIIGGCSSGSSSPTSSPLPTSSSPQPTVALPTGEIPPNDSIVHCQVMRYRPGQTGLYPTELRVYLFTSQDVEGLENLTRDKTEGELTGYTDEDVFQFMVGEFINARIQVRPDGQGGSLYYIYDLEHIEN